MKKLSIRNPHIFLCINPLIYALDFDAHKKFEPRRTAFQFSDKELRFHHGNFYQMVTEK